MVVYKSKSAIAYCVAGFFLLAQHAVASIYPPTDSNGHVAQQLVSAKNYMVSSANPYASEAGAKILAQGGTAIDAAIAVQMVLTLVEPESSGIGGGGFALHWDNQNKQLTTYDGREKAPSLADGKLFQQDGQTMNWWDALAGGRAVGAPGIIAMLEKIHQQHGKLPWQTLFTDAIELARQGFEVSPKLAKAIANEVNPALGRYDTARQYFFPDGQPLKASTIKKNLELAATFERIATLGSEGFYQGPIASNIVNTVRSAIDNPGLLTEQDLRNYQAIERPAICTQFKSYKVCGMGPPTSGGMTVIQILKLLEQKNLQKLRPTTSDSIHLFTQASRLAYADRGKYMADADFVAVPVEGLIDESYLQHRAQLINDRDTPATAGTPPNANKNWRDAKSPEQPSTTHFSIVDSYGNGISMTSSIEMAFGSTLMTDGFLLNNQLTDFSFTDIKDEKLVANRVQGGKRPRSSMSPFMIFNQQDELILLIGSPGGSRIPSYVAKAILSILEWDLDVQSAINLPHYINRNGTTELEKNTTVATAQSKLEALGHGIKVKELTSGLHAIAITSDGLEGAADPRRFGRVVGD